MRTRRTLAIAIIIHYALIMILINCSSYYECIVIHKGTDVSQSYSSVTDIYACCMYLGILAMVYVTVRSFRKKDITGMKGQEIPAYVIAILSNIASLLYMHIASAKYYPIMYTADGPFLNDEGHEVELMQTMTVPMIVTLLGIVMMIAGCILVSKQKKDI